MKSLKSILLALVLICATSMTVANNPAEDPSLKERASQEIADLLNTPTFNVIEDISASISLIVNEDGELVVLNVKSSEDQVEQFVKSRLNYHKLDTPLSKGHAYTVPLTIVSQS